VESRIVALLPGSNYLRHLRLFDSSTSPDAAGGILNDCAKPSTSSKDRVGRPRNARLLPEQLGRMRSLCESIPGVIFACLFIIPSFADWASWPSLINSPSGTKVAIGTTSPNAVLDVAGTSTIGELLILSGAGEGVLLNRVWENGYINRQNGSGADFSLGNRALTTGTTAGQEALVVSAIACPSPILM
jgi:hypothetical protein